MNVPIDYRAIRFMQMAMADNKEGTVIQGLNLVLKLQNPAEMPILLAAIMKNRPNTNRQLETLNFVHSARFLPTPDDSALQVITVFDGAIETYVDEFVASIGDTFDLIMSFVLDSEGAKGMLPVRNHPAKFVQYVKDNNRVQVNGQPTDFWPVFSAYPTKTVLEVADLKKLEPNDFVDAASHYIDEDDVQGNILRANGARAACHFAIEIARSSSPREFLRAITDGVSPTIPQVTPESLSCKRDRQYYLSIGFTYAGLEKLGVPPASLTAFPPAYREGPAATKRAKANGDFGDSGPDEWVLGAPGQDIHLFLSLFASDDTVLNQKSDALVALITQHNLNLAWQRGTRLLQDNKGYFGYKDGIAQPRIAGVQNNRDKEDLQPRAGVGEFLLGTDYQNAYGAKSIGGIPETIGQNGAFAAIRIMEQDVDAFENMLSTESTKNKVDKEFVAAKMMGRWRDGRPLSLTQDAGGSTIGQDNGKTIADKDINQFDFASSGQHKVESDHDGLVCPVGSHIRRMNPRSAPAVGKPYSRRIVRRGMPYQWEDESGNTTRGLFGVFICADLERQYEFLLAHWGNGDIAARGTRGTQDPIVGAQNISNAEPPTFKIPMPGGKENEIHVGISRFVHTRGSLYVLLPGMSTLRALSGQEPGDTSEEKKRPSRFDLMTGGGALDASYFSVHDRDFQNDPYKFYNAFRNRGPVQWIREHNSYWVFSTDLIEQVTCQTGLFLKQPSRENWVRGLFFMDPPDHTDLREKLEPIFARIMMGSAAHAAKAATDGAIKQLKAGGPSAELVKAFTHRVPCDTFMSLLGADARLSAIFDGQINTMFRTRDRANPANVRVKAFTSAVIIEKVINDYLNAGGTFPENSILHDMQKIQQTGRMSMGVFVQTALHMLMGGYLSTQFLITTGIQNYLTHYGPTPNARGPFNGLTDNAIEEMLRFDAPFQMADRYAARDTVLGGVPIRKNSMVVVVYGSANRDAARYQEPCRFDISRTNVSPDASGKGVSPHYGFGGESNIHRCIGEHLAKRIAGTAINSLFAAFPAMRLDDGGKPDYQVDPYFRSLNTLPVLLSSSNAGG